MWSFRSPPSLSNPPESSPPSKPSPGLYILLVGPSEVQPSRRSRNPHGGVIERRRRAAVVTYTLEYCFCGCRDCWSTCTTINVALRQKVCSACDNPCRTRQNYEEQISRQSSSLFDSPGSQLLREFKLSNSARPSAQLSQRMSDITTRGATHAFGACAKISSSKATDDKSIGALSDSNTDRVHVKSHFVVISKPDS